MVSGARAWLVAALPCAAHLMPCAPPLMSRADHACVASILPHCEPQCVPRAASPLGARGVESLEDAGNTGGEADGAGALDALDAGDAEVAGDAGYVEDTGDVGDAAEVENHQESLCKTPRIPQL